MRGVIRNIVKYCRDMDLHDEVKRGAAEEMRKADEYDRLMRRLPDVIRRMERTVEELKRCLPP